jgi:cell division transport system permease protein
MKLALVRFVMRRVLQSLRELFWTHLLTSGVMAMTLFVFGGFLLIQENVSGFLKGWSDEFKMFAYLGDDVTPPRLDSIRALIRSYPEVKDVRYVSKEDAWKSFEKSLGSQSGILDGLSPKILPASLEIEIGSPAGDRQVVVALAQKLKGIAGIQEVEYPESWLEKIRLLRAGIEWFKWILGSFLFLVSFLIVASTIKLAIMARRDEIEIMQLVGATSRLIKAPFVLEGMIQGLLGACFALVLLSALFSLVTAELFAPLGPAVGIHKLVFLRAQESLFLVFLGWLLGTGGSLLSVKRYLV